MSVQPWHFLDWLAWEWNLFAANWRLLEGHFCRGRILFSAGGSVIVDQMQANYRAGDTKTSPVKVRN
jgi:hypothetical protein